MNTKKKQFEYYKTNSRLPVTTKKRNDLSDYDYLKHLNKKEFNWIMGFHHEYVNASKNHKWKRHYKTKAQFREIYNRNNSNNRCMYTLAKVLGLLNLAQDIPEYDPRYAPDLTEDYMIALIDNEIEL